MYIDYDMHVCVCVCVCVYDLCYLLVMECLEITP